MKRAIALIFVFALILFAQLGPTPGGTAQGDLCGNYPNPTVCGVNGATVPASSTLNTTNSSGQIVQGDFYERYMVPAANCYNGTPGAAWSTATSTPTCRAGSNNLGGYVAITDSTTAQFMISIPADWDTSVDPFVLFALSSADTTNTHTIIPTIQVSCPTATNGTVSDDHAFAAAHSATTITIGSSAVANGLYTTSVQMNSTDVSGCVAGAFMIIRVGRATDTGTSAYFWYANVTLPRKNTAQAN